jgi:hypothetical protein
MIQAFRESRALPMFVHPRNKQRINAMVRSLTLQDPELVGSIYHMAVSDRGNEIYVTEEEAFQGSKCLKSDRTEFLEWVGKFTARMNWRDKGEGAAPVVVTAAAALMQQWSTIAWYDRLSAGIPSWCQNEIIEAGKRVYPTKNQTDPYLPASEVLEDLHTFLMAWRDQRALLGRHRRKKLSPANNTAAAQQMTEQLIFLRALALTHPDTIPAEDVEVMKSMGDLINTPPRHLQILATLTALEERAFLEDGLGKIPETNGAKDFTRRKRTL